MSLTRVNRVLLQRLSTAKKYSTSALENEEYTTTPQYPPILDLSYEAKLKRRKQEGYDEIRRVKTIEEKQIKLNMPRYYGFKCYMLHEGFVPYDQLKFTQHATRTHLIVNDELPDFYKGLDVDKLSLDVKSDIEDAILLEYSHYRRRHEFENKNITEPEREAILSNAISKNINRILLNAISKEFPHLKEAQVDFDPRIESFWFAGGMDPPENIKRCRKGVEWRKHTENDPTNRAMQYLGNPAMQIRAKLPLKQVMSYGDAENPDLDVPHFKYDPRTVGVATVHRHVTNIPGFWAGDKSKFGLISYHDRSHFSSRNYNDPEEQKEAVHRQGILSSFGWLNAQANYLGFTTYNDITYPLVTQSVVTNGKIFSFYVYQLNTLLMHSENWKNNPKRNVCWATNELKLFEEISGDKLIGFNDEILKRLLKFYVNSPEERLGLNMTPYLSNKEKTSSDYDDSDKRQWLEREYKFLMANRPRYKLDYEIYHWEKIYKIDHDTRFMEPRRRPFELFKKPWNRKLNERQAFYVPKVLRPDLPKHKGRYEKEYFP